MTTTRALLRSRIIQPGTLSQIVSDVNRLLGADTALSGNFMTLFVMVMDCKNKWVRWVRAGHDASAEWDANYQLARCHLRHRFFRRLQKP